jgi:hypothetical protein
MSSLNSEARDRGELRRDLLARSKARRNSLRGRIAHGIMLIFLALACVSALASFVVKDHMGIDPKIAAGILLMAAGFGRELMGKKPGRLAELGAQAAVVLWGYSFVQWLDPY